MAYQNIPEYLEDIAKKYKDKTALQIRRILRTDRFTYRQLYELSLKTSSFLKGKKIESGDCIFIWAPNMPEWIIAFLGTISIGAVAVPVGLHSTSQLIEKYMNQTKPKIVFLSKYYPVDINKSLKGKFETIYLEDLPGLLKDEEIKELPKVRPEQLAQLVFTSGTTGEPKGVMISHQNILSEVDQILRILPPEKNYRMLSILPLSHVLEQIAGVFVPLSLGGTLYYLPRINMISISRALRKHKITHLGVVPQILRMFLDNIEYQATQQHKQNQLNYLLKIAPLLPFPLRRFLFKQVHKLIGGKLKIFVCGSAPLDVRLARNWEAIGIKVVEGYGLSETTAAVSANRIDKRKLGSVGPKLPGIEIKLTQEKEIIVSGGNVTHGYYHNDEKTKEAFDPEGFFKTGDVGYFDREGYLYITGRQKFKIVTSSGDKVYPEDIEKKLNTHPGVWDSCVFGLKKGEEEIIYASVILEKGNKIKLEQVIKEVNSTLEPNQYIQEFSLWSEKDFPRLHTLKVDRSAVKEKIENLAKGNLEVPAEEAAEDKSDTLKSVLSRVCKMPAGKIKENNTLVGLGLDSLKRVELVSLIEQELNAQVDEGAIHPATTLKDLRKLISQHKETKFSYSLEDLFDLLSSPLNQKIKALLQSMITFPFFKTFVHINVQCNVDWENLTGPMVFVGNHPSPLDAVCLLQALPARIREKLIVIVDDESWKNKKATFIQKFYSLISGAFPIDKTGPMMKTLDLVLDFLDNKQNLLLLPEGRFTPPGEKLAPLKKGMAVLFANTGIPVIPYYIAGNINKTFPQGPGIKYFKPQGFSDVTIKIGQPFTIPDISEEDATELIRKRILEQAEEYDDIIKIYG